MDVTDDLKRNKQQITDKASDLAESAKPYVDQVVKYAKANPVEAMAATGVLAFLLGGIFFGSRR